MKFPRALAVWLLLVLPELGHGQVYPFFPPPGITYDGTITQTAFSNLANGTGQCVAGTGTIYSCSTAVPNLVSQPTTGSTQGRDLLLAAGLSTVGNAPFSLKTNGWDTTLALGNNGDALWWFANGNPMVWQIAGNPATGTREGAGSKWGNDTSVVPGSTQGINWLGWGISESGASSCPASLFGVQFPTASVPAAPCSWVMFNGYPLALGPYVTASLKSVAYYYMDPGGNAVAASVGLTTPVKWYNVTSTGTSQASVTLGDTNAASLTNIVGGSLLTTQANGSPIVTGFPAVDTVLQGQGASAEPTGASVPNCGSSTQALAYSTGTHAFSCQTISAGGTTTGSFTGTLAIGCTTTPTATFFYQVDGSTASIWLQGNLTCTSNAATLQITGLPNAVNPAHVHMVPCTELENAGTPELGGVARLNADNTLAINLSATGGGTLLTATNGQGAGFTTSGAKGMTTGWTIVFPLN